ncbi:uncharacterized protein LOC126685912 [Mercurialis annua]|uniref:uncharacterized protein LOC126685912 n=1 Tax=Mercurialis annua TaxID=3986 RepID=UPI00216097EC|nr:uncharacterized protein LOC126685912 [Mercurialis annua]
MNRSDTVSKSRNQFMSERRPRMLKDFLIDESNSCSSNGFRSFPRYPADSLPVRTLIKNDLDSKNSLTRTRSSISAFQNMIINAIKNMQFMTAVKSTSILPRTLSRRLSSKRSTCKENQENKETEVKVTVVTIKDIIRWKSFRDLIEEKSPPSDLPPSSPHHYTTTTTTTGSTATTPCSRSSNGSTSSWCDSDFTAENLPCSWDGNEVVKVGKLNLPRVGEDTMEAATTDKAEERQQNSPVSVIDNTEFEEDDDDDYESSSFERTKQKFMQKIQKFERLARVEPINLEKWMPMDENASSSEEDEEEIRETNSRDQEVEEKAWELLSRVKETNSLAEFNDGNVERIVFDFFRDELSRNRNESEMMRRVKKWMNGEDMKWTGSEKKEVYVSDMEKEGNWGVFQEEQQELGLAIENGIMGLLVDDLLIDLIS